MERWLVVYDTPDDRRRRRMAKVLDAYGERVQYSVFEVLAEGAHLERMLARLARTLDEGEDRLRLYPLCERCVREVLTLAGEMPEPWEEHEVYII